MSLSRANLACDGERGIGLLEVVIYAALSLIVLTLAIGGLTGMQKKAFRTQEMSRVHNEADETVRLIAQDARNLGLKRILFSAAPGSFVDTQLVHMHWGASDSSSFVHKDGTPFDSLQFLKPRLNAIGKPIAIDTVLLAVNPMTRTLYRTVNGGAPIEMCRKVESLQFEYGVSAVKTVLFSETTANLAHWSQSPLGLLSVSGSSMRATANAAGSSSFWLSHSPLQLNANHTYQWEMTVSASKGFLAHVDSMRAILCNAAGTPIASQRFLPSQSVTPITLEWSGLACTGCYAGFRMHMSGAGEFFLTSLKVTDVRQGDGIWVHAPTLAQKKGVRAFRIHLLTHSKQGIFGVNKDTLKLANVTLAFEDNLGRSLLEDVISIPNNGF